jgi:DNA replication and repair protein RecF
MSLDLTPNFNIFWGENGAGKTSLIEAIYYLGLGKSFRTHLANRIIENDQPGLLLTANFNDDDGQDHFLGLERNRDGERIIKLDRETQSSIAPIARLMPLQLLSVDSYRYFSDGPKERRSFLDWGVFHINIEFLELWQRYNRVLKQRNMALKNRLPKSEITVWDNEYIELSESIDAFRAIYIDAFKKVYHEILLRILPSFKSADIRYKRGWAKDRGLADLLDEHFTRDSAFGYTQDGPHRSDFQLYIDSCPADDILSQGQQKLAAYSLHLAQGILLKKQTGKSPIYLIDDLPSELDASKQGLILQIIRELNSQVFITGITADKLNGLMKYEDSSMFHVEHGSIEPDNVSRETLSAATS